MAQFTVTTPVAGHSGKVGGVQFIDGAAVVDDGTHAPELAYFRAQGYGVEAAELEPDIDKLRADADALGIKRVGNKSAATLQAEIDAALAANPETPDEGNDKETQS